jgi:hypothetical protein
MNAKITDIERAALTLLSTPEYLRAIEDKKPLYNAVVEILSGTGQPVAQLKTVNEYNPKDRRYKYTRQNRGYALAICILAGAICVYRMDGRPTGDQSYQIASGITVRSSLAAAVVEFHKQIVNAIYQNVEG